MAMREFDGVMWTTCIHERLVERIGCHHTTHGNRPIGDLLGKVQQVRFDAECLSARPRARAAEAGDDFVKNEQDLMLVADLPKALQIAHRRDDHASRSAKRFDDHGSDVRRIMQRDEFQQLVGEFDAGGGHSAAEGIAGQHRVGQVIGIDSIAVHFSIADHSSDTDAGKGHAVVPLGTTDESGLARLTLDTPIRSCHLEGRIRGF